MNNPRRRSPRSIAGQDKQSPAMRSSAPAAAGTVGPVSTPSETSPRPLVAAAVVLGLVVFGAMACAATFDVARGADAAFVAWVSRGPDSLETLAEIVMTLGTVTGLTLVWLPASILRFQRPRPVVAVVAATLIARWAARFAKDLFESPRPTRSAQLVVRQAVDGFGFPSAHAAVAAAAATAWAWHARPRERAVVLAIAGVVGALRWYVGVHYVVDVVGGLAIGVAAGTIAMMLSRVRVGSRG